MKRFVSNNSLRGEARNSSMYKKGGMSQSGEEGTSGSVWKQSSQSHGLGMASPFIYLPEASHLGVARLGGQRALGCGGAIIPQFPNLMRHRHHRQSPNELLFDAVFSAMSAMKYDDIPLLVTETGWPSKGDENEI
ncbi:hypothetical protein L6452_01531 [Arctium lappa]|uniref:Uncharacterized protein n=1 Tax=Arctium lappa TaxID=4217 RepID=A0ACB9FGX8_ARCLA|nr:hypothetical protein L6452_01531 [Arctium lappa]